MSTTLPLIGSNIITKPTVFLKRRLLESKLVQFILECMTPTQLLCLIFMTDTPFLSVSVLTSTSKMFLKELTPLTKILLLWVTTLSFAATPLQNSAYLMIKRDKYSHSTPIWEDITIKWSNIRYHWFFLVTFIPMRGAILCLKATKSITKIKNSTIMTKNVSSFR